MHKDEGCPRPVRLLRQPNVTDRPADCCPVCLWDSWEVMGPNAISLSEARSNYARFGVSELRFKDAARPARPEELPSEWRAYFTVGDLFGFDVLQVHQRLASLVRTSRPRQALSLPVDAVDEALPLLDPIYAHYVAQWPKIVPPSGEDELGLGFFLEGSVVHEQIADPSHADQLVEIYLRGVPDKVRSGWGDEGLGDPPYALTVDDRLIEWDIYMSRCVPAAGLGIEPYPR